MPKKQSGSKPSGAPAKKSPAPSKAGQFIKKGSLMKRKSNDGAFVEKFRKRGGGTEDGGYSIAPGKKKNARPEDD